MRWVPSWRRHKLARSTRADKRCCNASFQVDDHVLLDARNLALLETCKLADHYVGPFRITAKFGPTAYHLKLPANMAIHDVFHIGLWKPYQQPSSSFPAVLAAAHHCRWRTGVGDTSNQEPSDGSWQAIVFSIMGWSRQFRGPVDVGAWARECQTTPFWLQMFIEIVLTWCVLCWGLASSYTAMEVRQVWPPCLVSALSLTVWLRQGGKGCKVQLGSLSGFSLITLNVLRI